MLEDIFNIVINGLHAVKSFSTLQFTLGFAFAGVLAALTWMAAVYSAKLWNMAYHTKPVSHVLGFFAALLTFFYVIIFISFGKIDALTRLYVDVWSESLKINQPWQEATFKKAFYAAKETDPEGFLNVKSPENGGDFIPVRDNNVRVEVAWVYASMANQNFKTSHPFLNRILFGNNIKIARKDISNDMQAYFSNNNDASEQKSVKTEIEDIIDKYAANVDLSWVTDLYQANGNTQTKYYQAAWAVDLASENIKKQLHKRVKRVKFLARTGLTLVFIVLQLIPFGLIGFMAYRDLKT